MASLSELARTIAQVEGLEEATVNLIGRYVREDGLIATGGRGTSAATMTARDAANLLIAVNATTVAVDAPNTTRTYRALETYGPPKSGSNRPPISCGTFGQALEQ